MSFGDSTYEVFTIIKLESYQGASLIAQSVNNPPAMHHVLGSGLGRSTVEGIDYPLQYSWASLVAQLVKNLPAMRET